MRKIGVLVACFLAVAFVGGCQDKFSVQFEGRKVSIETEPSGAVVYQVNVLTRNKTELGVTPLLNQMVMVPMSMKGGKVSPGFMQNVTSQLGMMRLIIEKDGYKRYESNLYTKRGETVVHRIVLERKEEDQ